MRDEFLAVEYVPSLLSNQLFLADYQCAGTIMLVLFFAFDDLCVSSVRGMVVRYIFWSVVLIAACFYKYSYVHVLHELIERF